MSFSENPRFRINAKQTAKNLWQLDATVEYKNDKIKISTNPDDTGDEIITPLGVQLLSLIKETEKAFRTDGRVFVGDKE